MEQAGRLPHSETRTRFTHTGPGERIDLAHHTGVAPTFNPAGLKVGLVGGLLLLLTIPTFQSLWALWSTRADASHGFLIPWIALLLVYSLLPELRQQPIKPSPGLGLPLLITAAAGILLADAGAIVTLSGLSFMALIAGVILTLFGGAWLRTLLFPVTYLAFMVPLIESLVEPLQPRFQFVTATMARLLLRPTSIPVFQDDTTLWLPTGTVEVAAECSGIGFLISVMAVGLPLVMMGLRTWPIRAILIITTLVLSIGVNWLRVALIALSGHVWGWSSDLHGPLHILHAMSVYWIGLGILLCGLWVGRTVERSRPHTAGDRRPPVALTQELNARPEWTRVWAVTCVLLGAAVAMLYTTRSHDVPLLEDLARFPSTVGSWEWETATDDDPPFTIEQADRQLLRTYRHTTGDRVQLYLGYLASQRQGKELIDHHTERLHRQAAPRMIVDGDASLVVNRTRWERHDQPYDMLFWYQANGRAYADRLTAKFMSSLSILRGHGSHGALVVISRHDSPHDVSQTREAELDAFVRSVSHLAPTYVP